MNQELVDRYMAATGLRESIEANTMKVIRLMVGNAWDDFLNKEDWAILERCVKENLVPLTLRITAEELVKHYTDDQLLTMIQYHEANPWASQKAAEFGLTAQERVQAEGAQFSEAAFQELVRAHEEIGLDG